MAESENSKAVLKVSVAAPKFKTMLTDFVVKEYTKTSLCTASSVGSSLVATA